MKTLFKKFLYNKFKSIFQIILKSQSNFFNFDFLSLKLKNKCKLGEVNDILYLRFDEIISPNVIKYGCWDYFIIKFIKKKLKKNIKYKFIDLGANIGLITRQIMEENFRQIKEFHCIEPQYENFNLLKKNLKKFSSKKIFYHNFAITNSYDSKKKLYINPNNFGDYRLSRTSGHKFNFVNTININNFFKKNFKEKNKDNIIYKSDIQGMDEIVLLSINEKILKKIQILIIEISNPIYLMENIDKFKKVLSYFKNRETNTGEKLSITKIEKKIINSESFDLLLCRDK